MPADRPNIIYLHSHDTGRYIQPYGRAVKTPKLQQFAEEGVLFRHAFCANPSCSPSRAALLTGMYPHNNGMTALAHRGGRLRDYNQHVTATLNAAGYETVLAGVQHVAHGGQAPPYSTRLTSPGTPDEETTEAAVDFIQGAHERPFFLACGYFRTHRTGGDGWHNGEESPLGDGRYILPPAPLPDTPECRQDFADFAVCAERLDAQMGRVIDAVDAAGLRETTLIIVTTDHGIAFPHMKCNLTDHGIGVMLMMRGPAPFGGGRAIPAPVSHLDIFPTLCELLCIEAPAWLQGRSLLPLLRGEADRVHEAIFAEVNFHGSYEPMRAVRTERYKYIRRLDPRPHPVLPNCDNSLSKDLLIERAAWRGRPQQREYLYDLLLDPNEAANRAGDPTYGAALEEMRERLDAWLIETDDPFRHGHVPHWPGTIVNPPEDRGPNEPDHRIVLE